MISERRNRLRPPISNPDNVVAEFFRVRDAMRQVLRHTQHDARPGAGEDILRVLESELELAKIIFENEEKVSLPDWQVYNELDELQNSMRFGADERLSLFKEVFLKADGDRSNFRGYRLSLR